MVAPGSAAPTPCSVKTYFRLSIVTPPTVPRIHLPRRNHTRPGSTRLRHGLHGGCGRMIDAGDLAQVVHRARVGVLDGGGGPRLPVEALDDGRPVVRAEVRHLEGDGAAQLRVL